MLKPVRPLLVGALIVFSFAGGCASPGHEKADDISSDMGDFRRTVVGLQEKVSAAALPLGEIVDRGTDPKVSYEHLDESTDELEDALERTDDRLSSLRKLAQSYFDGWQAEAASISDAELQKRSDERRAKLSAALDEIVESMEKARSDVQVYLGSLKDLRTYLSADLTPAGIESIQDKAQATSESADGVNDRLDQVLKVVQGSAPMFATAKPPAR